MKILWTLAVQFFLISFLAVGGVSAALPEIHRVFVNQLHLMNNETFNSLFALSQSAPGPNLLFVGLFGLKIAGISGALVSLIALCVPTLLLSVVVEKYGSKYKDSRFYSSLRKSLSPIAIGLLISTSILLIKSATDLRIYILAVISVVLLLTTKVPPLLLMFAGALLGATGIL